MKHKLAYIVTEQGCLDPTTGAYQHISMGIRELNRYAEVVTFLSKSKAPSRAAVSAERGVPKVSGFRSSGIWGALRDMRDFLQNAREGWRVARQVRAAGCEAAYVRVQGLQPISIFLRCYGIKVFLEANGLQFESRKHCFKSWLSSLYRPFERYLYLKADHVFFVGSYGTYWKLPSNNWSEVENGIEPEMLQSREVPVCAGNPIKIVLLARLVAHHKGQVLADALKHLSREQLNHLELHLVGSGFDQLKLDLDQVVEVVDHGFVGREEIGALLRQMDIGVIPNGPPYSSQMKLLDYAAAGCLVVAPDVPHLVNFYQDRGVLFFEYGSAGSLSEALLAAVSKETHVSENAQRLQSHVADNYTWEAIFKRKFDQIHQCFCNQ
jgi:glycosyltransferase involved in cell wall biosynthesis